MSEIRLGKTAQGELVTVEIKLEAVEREALSVNHEFIPAGTVQRLSIQGVVYRNARMVDWNITRAGQCAEALREVVKPEAPWTLREIQELHSLWLRWHLNDMHAGCVHQAEVVYEDSEYGRRVNLNATTEANDCPASYRYGSAHLVEPLPAWVVEKVQGWVARQGWRV